MNHSKDILNEWREISLNEISVSAIGGDWGESPNRQLDGYTETKVVRGTEFRNWEISKTKNAVLRQIPDESLAKRKLEIGDIIVEVSGGGPEQPVGRTVIIDGESLNGGYPIICSNFFRRVRLSKHINPFFVNHYLQFAYRKGYFNDIQNQTTNLRNLQFKRFLEKPIPIAPIQQQDRIVEKLNEIINISAKSALKELEIARLEDEAFKGYIYNVDDVYPTVELGQYCTERTNRIGNKWKNLKLIGVSNEHGITDLRVGGKKTFENYKIVESGDFIYNPMRVDIGSIAIWQEKEMALTSPDYIVFTLNHTISPLLLLKFLKSPIGLAEINNNTQGSVRSRLYFRNFSKIAFPFCGLEGQNEAQVIFESFLRLKLEALKLRNQMLIIVQESFKRAFDGTLVDSEVGDESVDLLIEKIKNEKKSKDVTQVTFIKKSMKKTKTSEPILKVISDSKVSLSPEEVWARSIYKNDIDGFYAELKKLIEHDKIITIVKEGDEHYLKLSHEN